MATPQFGFVRLLRTMSSERFMVRLEGQAVAALELHYLPGNKVDGTLICFEEAHLPESQFQEILSQIDEHLLPEVTAGSDTAFFTVVVGKVHGSFEPHEKKPA